MGVRRDGFGCLPLLAVSGLGLFVLSVLPAGLVDDAVRSLLALACCALPLLYFWSPRRPEESVLRSTSRAARFHRIVRNELGVDPKLHWWNPFASHRVRMQVADVVLPLLVRRRRFRKYPDVLLELSVKDVFPPELSFSQPGLLHSAGTSTGDVDFDGRVHLVGPPAVWLSVLDESLRERLATAVRDRKLVLRRGRLQAEVHGLDLKSRGLEQVREFVGIASGLRAASTGPVTDRLLLRARNDRDLVVRTHAARALWSLEASSDRAEALRESWLVAPEAILRVAACAASEPEQALPVLADLAGDPASPGPHRVLAVRRIGGLEHVDVVSVLRGLSGEEPDLVVAIAEELARHGEQGGGLALAEGGEGGELAFAGGQGGEVALAGERGGEVAVAGGEVAVAVPRAKVRDRS